MAQPGAREAGYAGIQQHAIHVALVLRCGSAGEGQRRRPQAEVEQAVSETGLVVVVALGLRGGDAFDLPPVEAEALVARATLGLGRLRGGEETAARGATAAARKGVGVGTGGAGRGELGGGRLN